uniref:Fibronectin type-III domain-containing protein n=1 Tax=Amphimedon queenslandica TaxID=400682 RepID=A0A1X7SMA7_AMPQE
MYSSIIDVLTYNNTILVYPDPLGVSVNVTCIAMLAGVNYSQSVILHAPSGPPNNVRGFILNATSIKVNWTTSSETNGYVIESNNFSTPSDSSIHSDSVIALGVSVGVLLILLTVSVAINICCFIRNKVHFATGATIKDPKADKDIALQVCQTYQIHKTEVGEEIEVVYDECHASPDATRTYYEL